MTDDRTLVIQKFLATEFHVSINRLLPGPACRFPCNPLQTYIWFLQGREGVAWPDTLVSESAGCGKQVSFACVRGGRVGAGS